jgi:hypothetical protein
MSRPLLLQSRPQSCTGSSIPARSATGGRQEGCDGAETGRCRGRPTTGWPRRHRRRTAAAQRARRTGSARWTHGRSGWRRADTRTSRRGRAPRTGGEEESRDGGQTGGDARRRRPAGTKEVAAEGAARRRGWIRHNGRRTEDGGDGSMTGGGCCSGAPLPRADRRRQAADGTRRGEKNWVSVAAAVTQT